MTTKDKMTVRIYNSERDYAPVLVITDAGKVILKGDNIHDSAYEAMADGAAAAFESMGMESSVIHIEYEYQELHFNGMTDEDEAFLISNGQEAFLNAIKQF